jgi:hypothetical protein
VELLWGHFHLLILCCWHCMIRLWQCSKHSSELMSLGKRRMPKFSAQCWCCNWWGEGVQKGALWWYLQQVCPTVVVWIPGPGRSRATECHFRWRKLWCSY